jgi:hypothetical protein
MYINKKYIIVFSTLVLLLIIIIGGITYYQEKEDISFISNAEKYGYYLIPSEENNFFHPNPTDLEEFLDFINFCETARFSDVNELKHESIKQVACFFKKMSPSSIDLYGFEHKPYLPGFSPLKLVSSFEAHQYIGISVDLKDAVREYDPALLEEENLYFCSISEPFWADPFSFELDNVFLNFSLFGFEEGSVRCQVFEKDEYPMAIFTGFVPKAGSLSIKEYFVNEQVIYDIMYKGTFSEMKEILNDYPVIWQMEKPII